MALPTLRQASFRAVQFGVSSSEDATGRRVSVDSMPGRDLPASEDFGAAVRRISFEAFVVGQDYQERAERLVEVCAQRSTPGRLSLPYIQAAIVRPVLCVRRESSAELRMARFQLAFVEVDRVPSPARRTGGVQALDAAAASLAEAGTSTMADDLVVTGVPNSVLVAGGDEVARAGSALQALGVVRDSVEKGADLARRASEFIRDAQALVLEPVTLASKLSDAIELVALTAKDALASLYAYRTLAALRPRVFSDYLSTRNARLVSDATRLCAIAGWSRAAARVDWPTYEDAVDARRAIEVELDSLAGEASDQVYAAASDLRARLAAQVPAPNRKLPHLRQITLWHSTSAITLAYRLFDDVTRDAEIVSRNRARHPSFLPAAVKLEVLTDA